MEKMEAAKCLVYMYENSIKQTGSNDRHREAVAMAIHALLGEENEILS